MISFFSMWFPVLIWFHHIEMSSVNTFTGSFSMIFSFKLRMIVWLKKLEKKKIF